MNLLKDSILDLFVLSLSKDSESLLAVSLLVPVVSVATILPMI